MNKRFKLTITMLLFAGSLMLVEPPAIAATYSVTTGAYNGTREAARTAINETGGCSGLTRNKLAALMLSIPVWEVAGGSRTTSVSPMTLSRWDGWSLRTANRNLYSHVEYSNYKRAHWNPGIGMWQLDTWADTLHLNQGQRMHTKTGGLPVARYLRDGFCAGTSTIRSRLNNNWFACRWGRCWDTFNDMYIDATDSLDVNLTAGLEWDGGVKNQRCRWGSNGNSFACYWVNTNLHQGWMDTSDPNGDGARSPLASGFLSLTTGSNKRAVWLRSSGLGKEIVKYVRTNQGARAAGNWYDNTSLQVYKCNSSGRCWWSLWGLNL